MQLLTRLNRLLTHAGRLPAVAPFALLAQWKRRGKLSDDPEFTYDEAETWLLKVAIALPLLIIAVLVCVYLTRRVANLMALLFKKRKNLVDGTGTSVKPQAEKPPSKPNDSLTGTTPPPV